MTEPSGDEALRILSSEMIRRKAVVRNLESLQNCVLRFIHTHLDYYLQFPDPFGFLSVRKIALGKRWTFQFRHRNWCMCLFFKGVYGSLETHVPYRPGGPVLQSVKDFHMSQELEWNPKYFHMGITENASKLTFRWREQLNPYESCRLITLKCGKNLKSLVFDSKMYSIKPELHWGEIERRRPELLIEIVKRSPNLEELIATDSGVSDDFLYMLPSWCPKLRKLHVGNKVTFLGFRYVCEKCKFLEDVNISGTVGLSELYFAMENLQNLRVLEHDRIFRALEIFSENMLDGVPCENFKGNLHIGNVNSMGIDKLSKMYPNIETISVRIKKNDPFNWEAISNIGQFKNVRNLKFSYNISGTNYSMQKFFFFETLVSLKLENLPNDDEDSISRVTLDYSIIGEFCPNLKDLEVHFVAQPYKIKYPSRTHHFANLQDVTIFTSEQDPNSPMFQLVLLQMLCSPVLKKFSLAYDSVSTQTLSEVIVRAHENNAILSNLENLKISVPALPFLKGLELISLAPKLTSVFLRGWSEELRARLREVMSRLAPELSCQ